MNVQSLAFLAFLTVTVCACRLLGQKRQVWALLAASLVFYLWNGAAGVWWSCGLLAASSAVSLLAGNSLRRQRRRGVFLAAVSLGWGDASRSWGKKFCGFRMGPEDTVGKK